MTNKNSEQFMTALRDIRLTDAEHNALRTRLAGYIAMHPVRPAFWTVLARHALAYSLTAVFLLAGSTFAFACYAKPDSILYPVRVAITDPIAVTVSGDEIAQLEKELQQLERSIGDEQSLTDKELVVGDDDKTDQELETELNALERELNDALRDIPTQD